MKDEREPAIFMNILRGIAAFSMLLLAAAESHAAGVTIGVVAPQDGNLAAARRADLCRRQLSDQPRTAIPSSQSTNPARKTAARAIADALVNAKVQVAIGFLCSETLEGALPKLKDANIPAITVSVRARILMEDALKNGWPLFRLAPPDGAEAARIIEVILRDWAAAPIALIEDGTIHGRELTEAVRNALEEKGLKPVFTDTYRPGQEQQIALVRRLKRAGATKVFIGGDRTDVAVIARDAAAEKIPLDILGGDAMRAANQPVALSGRRACRHATRICRHSGGRSRGRGAAGARASNLKATSCRRLRPQRLRSRRQQPPWRKESRSRKSLSARPSIRRSAICRSPPATNFPRIPTGCWNGVAVHSAYLAHAVRD